MKYFCLVFISFLFLNCSNNKSLELISNEEDLFINDLLSTMSIEEKIGQTNLRGTSSRAKTISEDLKQSVREGKVGALLNVMKTEFVDELQKIADEGLKLIWDKHSDYARTIQMKKTFDLIDYVDNLTDLSDNFWEGRGRNIVCGRICCAWRSACSGPRKPSLHIPIPFH